MWFSVYLFVSMLSVYFASYLRQGSIALAGIASGIFFSVRAITDFASPRIFSDNKSLRWQIVIALILQISSFVLFFVLRTIYAAFTAVVVLAVALGMYSPAGLTLYSLVNRHVNERRWGNLSGIGLLAVAGGGFTSGLLINFGGFSLLFAVGIATSLITLGYVLLLIKKRLLVVALLELSGTKVDNKD